MCFGQRNKVLFAHRVENYIQCDYGFDIYMHPRIDIGAITIGLSIDDFTHKGYLNAEGEDT